ncbi:hypothetical protein PR003_g2882 [Phytophthora rubi]|uniref:BRCT domain-containing protein n=1 Tax=Phytophthora rubi TaxID=129364 RepID=A0A6A4G296_9STRA|nr:hypothetical protein PR002_g1066 [Phytophthora rubi]KAE9052017.1 hypothetical protein PR001_g895 [Phytophthora rubi]KAE9355358.1 hypothetical protein PR003_g2882 [Phytophthora rubi]
MAGEAACEFEGESSGQDTPVGFRDTPGQWYTANHRKRAALSQLEGEPTQRESQSTQEATEVATQPGESFAPVFVAATPSQEDNDRDEDEVDEDETQIRMTNSEEQDVPKPERKIFEEAVPLPIASIASETSRSFGAMGNSDDDADSDMSDDMLEQDGSIGGLSSIAASFQHRNEEKKVVEKRIYKPRTPFRASPAISTRDESDSSGNETEIEGEPTEESPAKRKASNNRAASMDELPLKLTKSASYTKATATDGPSDPEVKSIRRSLSTPERAPKLNFSSRSTKRDHSAASPASCQVKSKRSRQSEFSVSAHSLDQGISPASAEEVDQEVEQQKISPSRGSEFVEDVVEGSEKRIEVDVADESHSPPRHKASPPSRGRKRTTSSRSTTVNESAGSQADFGSIRVILTGLEPTAAIRKKIKSIAGAVYESNIEKATHVIAPQNQLKRTVKLLCGISCCRHILGERWLDESAQVGAAVDEQANCLRDKEAEDKWQFDLRSTMYSVPAEQRQRLFAGRSVFITNHKSVLPPVKDLVKIVECAGGKATSKGKPGPNDLVITSEAAMAVAAVRKQLASATPERIYSPELILSAVLQQRVQLDQHRLERPAIGKTWATKRRK